MPGLLIKNVPLRLTRKLKAAAVRHHRSMTGEALSILEEGLAQDERRMRWPEPVKGPFPLTNAFINRAKRQGRA